jgi:DNA-binding transcriptional LysR family regulator
MELSIRNLRYVKALAEHRHFGRAADELAISQPALTRSIQTLETELGVLLFDRQRRGGIEPTVFGKCLLKRGQVVLSECEEIVREIELLKGCEIGTLNISSGLYPTELSVARAAGELLKKHPHLQCQIRVTDWRQATEAVVNRLADIAVAELSEAVDNKQLTTEFAGQHELVFFCRPGHPILESKAINIELLLAYPWISTRVPKRIRDFLPASLGAAGWIDPANGDFVPAILVDGFSSAKLAVAGCDGLGAAPFHLMAKYFASGEFCEVRFRPVWLRLNYGFIYCKERTLSPVTLAFIAEVKKIELGILK